MSKSFDSVIKRLEKFSKDYYKNLILRGVLTCVTILVVFFVAICLIEYFSFLNSFFRKIIFWTYLIIMVSLFVKLVVLPIIIFFRSIKTPKENQRVAELIGRHFPEIEDKLINILELNEIDSFSKDLINASIERKYKKIEPYSFRKAIDWKKTIKYLKISSLPIVILLIIFFSGNTKVISQASNRLINYNQTFIPPPPFQFKVQNKTLEVLEKSDFVLTVHVFGKKIPDQLYINYKDKSYKMVDVGNNYFSHNFKYVERDIVFNIYAEEVESEKLKLSVLPAPILNKMEVSVYTPKHTKLGIKKIQNIGVFTAPEGSVISWGFKTKNTESLAFTMNDSTFIINTDSAGICNIKQQIYNSSKYSVSTSNAFSAFKDTLHYNIEIIKDSYPSILTEEIFDTINPKQKLIRGSIQDDYGFSDLILTVNIKNPDNDTLITEKIEIDYTLASQTFLKTFDINELPIKDGGRLEYFFTVYDNDKINNYKKTKSKSISFKKPSKKDMIDKLDEENENIENEIEDKLKTLESLSKDIENIEKALIEEDLEWKTKEKVKSLIKNYGSLEKSLKELERKINKSRKERNEVQNISPKLLEKQKQLEDLFNKIMSEELKSLFKELENSMDQIDKKDLQEKIEQLKMSNEDVEKELDRNLELLKQFEFDQKLEETLDELNNLKKKEENLSKESLGKNSNIDKLKARQQSNIEEFENLKESFDDLQKIKNELDPGSLMNFEKEENEIQETMENSFNQLEKNKKRQASKSQKSSAEQLSKLEEKLKAQQKEESIEQQEENIETLRQILENLIFFSKAEEDLMGKMNDIDSNDPQYVSLMHKQGDLRNDAKVIEDSLFALSKRIPQISATVNREINIIQEKTNEAIDYFRERETYKGAAKQQYIMTSANNLAVLLAGILEQIQKELSSDLPSSQECQKPGKGKPKPGDLKKMQKDLQDHMEKMKKGKKPGDSGQKFSEELVKMLAKQEKIRLALKEFENGLENNKDIKSLKEAIEKMEQTEQDIANKNITIETLLRQQQIITKLLELEGALRDQGESEERESNESVNYKNDEEINFKYELLKSYQKELLKTSPPSLTNYYKEKVNEYFNSLIKDDL